MKRVLTGSIFMFTALALMAGLPSTAPAQDGQTLYMTMTCIACHGPDANTPLMPDYPRLAGQQKAYILKQMKDIKSGARANGNSAAMKGVMHLVSDADMELIADWISSLK